MKYRSVVHAIAVIVLMAVTVTATAARAGNESKVSKANVTGASNAEAARARALRDGWPDTPAGMMGSAWVDAFSTGDDAMHSFLETYVAKADLDKRPLKERMKSYHGLRDDLGSLMFKSVTESTPHKLTVVLLAEDASPHRFVFTVEKESPHNLVQIGMLQQGHGHGGH